jgi:hypothetical protein
MSVLDMLQPQSTSAWLLCRRERCQWDAVTHLRACAKGNTASEDMSRWALARFAVPMACSRGSGGLLGIGFWKQPRPASGASHLLTTRSGAKSTIATRLRRNQPASSNFAAATAPWGPLRGVCFACSSVTTPEVHGLLVGSVSLIFTRACPKQLTRGKRPVV